MTDPHTRNLTDIIAIFASVALGFAFGWQALAVAWGVIVIRAILIGLDTGHWRLP